MLLYRMTVWARQVMKVRERGHVFGTFPRLLSSQGNRRQHSLTY